MYEEVKKKKKNVRKEIIYKNAVKNLVHMLSKIINKLAEEL